jgi:ribosomal protein S18 acetylase RimI-like enzyme
MERGNTTNRQIRLAEINPNLPAQTISDARGLLLEYGRFVLSQAGAVQFCFGSLEKEAAELPGSYMNQGGGALIAYARESPAGFVAWRALPAEVAPDSLEMKRLWVRSEARGLGIGRMLTMAVIDRARSARRSAIYLDTVPSSMGNAYRLYLELGFRDCPPYNDSAIEGITYLSLNI